MNKTVTTLDGLTLSLNTETVEFSIPMTEGNMKFYHILLKNGEIFDINENPFDDTPPLPEGFERLDFIETNGEGTSIGQYLNTTFKSGKDMVFKIRMCLTDGATGTSIYNVAKTMFTVKGYGGGAGTKSPGVIYVMYIEGDGTAKPEGSFYNPFVIRDPENKYQMHTYIIDYKNRKIGCDDSSWDMQSPVPRFADEHPFAIGGWYEAKSVYYRCAGKFESFEVTGEDETTHTYGRLIYLEPAITTRDILDGEGNILYPKDTPGMYDFTKKVFITNSGTGKLGYKKGEIYVPPVRN